MRRRLRSRRSLAAAACLGLLATACPGRPAPEPTTAPRPPPHGTFLLGYPEEPHTLNPILARSSAARDVLRAVLPSFHLVTPDLRYRPWLLAGEPVVTTQGQEMRVRFRLREASWSDGRPITVDDVAYTWRVMTHPDLPVTVADGFERIVDVARISATEGELVLSPPYAAWRDLFSAGRFVLPAPADGDPTAVEGWDEGPPVGGGPFAIEGWERGLRVRLVPNPGFFGPPPLVERLDVTFVPDAITAEQLLRAGELDAVAPALGVAWGRRLKAIPGAEVSRRTGPDLVHLILNAERIRDAAERRRIAGAIDRGRFADVLLRDEGARADFVLAPEQSAVPAWARYGEGEREEVRTRRELTLAYTRGELLDQAARFIQAQIESAGGDVELVALDADAFQGEWLPRRRFDLALWESRSGPGPWLSRWFSSGAQEGVSGLADTRLDALLERADDGGPQGSSALDQAQGLLAELVPVLPLFQPSVTMAWRLGVRGPVANPTADGPLWNAWDWSLPPV